MVQSALLDVLYIPTVKKLILSIFRMLVALLTSYVRILSALRGGLH
jgi:hypothetical protein